jgi:hypothetical protein
MEIGFVGKEPTAFSRFQIHPFEPAFQDYLLYFGLKCRIPISHRRDTKDLYLLCFFMTSAHRPSKTVEVISQLMSHKCVESSHNR